jgi:hypothetical protein
VEITALKDRREEQIADAYPRPRHTDSRFLSQSSGLLVCIDAEVSTDLWQSCKSTEGLGVRRVPKTSVVVGSDTYAYVRSACSQVGIGCM